LQEGQDREQQWFKEVTLEDLVKQANQRSELSYQI
jgi:hypothetical protein